MKSYKVSGMMCGGCVSNVKAKLEELAGCEKADVDLENATAVVYGDISSQTVVDTLTKAGYPATASE